MWSANVLKITSSLFSFFTPTRMAVLSPQTMPQDRTAASRTTRPLLMEKYKVLLNRNCLKINLGFCVCLSNFFWNDESSEVIRIIIKILINIITVDVLSATQI